MTYPRTDMGDGLGLNNVAGFDVSGNVLWRFDLGASNASGQPQIDSKGNVYVPFSGNVNNGVYKLTSAGALVWTYSQAIYANASGIAPSDLDNNENIGFRIGMTSVSGPNAMKFALRVDPNGNLLTTYKWDVVGNNGPLTLGDGMAFDASNNLWFCSDQAANTWAFDPTTGLHTIGFNISGWLSCDKTNGKLYVAWTTNQSPVASGIVILRQDLGTNTHDYVNTYDNIFHPDQLNYSECARTRQDACNIGFDASTGTVNMAMGFLQSDLGGQHIFAQTANLAGSTGLLNYPVVLDPNITIGIPAVDYMAVDGVGSHAVAGSYTPSPNSPFATMFGVTSGGASWSNATIAPGGTKGIASRTYTP